MSALFLTEIKKIFITRKGWLIVLLFFAAESYFTFSAIDGVNIALENSKSVFMEYEATLAGKFDDEKEALVLEKDEYFSNIPIEIAMLEMSFNSGEMSYTEYIAKIKEYSEITARSQAFGTVFNKYLYVKENYENRYFIYENGWSLLLTRANTQLFMFFALIILLVPIFCSEYETEVDKILITTKLGREKLCLVKITLGVGIALIFALFGIFADFISAVTRYGLPHGDFPLQSISFFGNSGFGISIFSTFLLGSFSRVLGSVLIAVLIVFLSVLTRKTISVLLVVCSVFLIPIFAPVPSDLIQRIPLPRAFFTPQNFLISGQKPEEVLFMFAGVVVFLCLCIFITFKKYLNKIIIISRKRLKPASLAAIILSLILLSGCSSETSEKSLVESGRVFYGGNVYKSDGFFGTLLSIDAQSGEVIEILRNPFLRDVQVVSISRYESNLYVSYKSDNVAYLSRIDLDTYNEEVLLETSSDTAYAGNNIIQLLRSRIQSNDRVIGSARIFATKDCLYLHAGMVYRFDFNTKNISELSGVSAGAANAFDGEYFYYINSDWKIAKSSVKTRKETIVADVYTNHFVVSGTKIIYRNLDELDQIGILDVNNPKAPPIFFNFSHKNHFICDDDYIYYISHESGKLYRMNLENGESEKISDNEYMDCFTFLDNDYIFGVNSQTGNIEAVLK
jgi:hypothetical protein